MDVRLAVDNLVQTRQGNNPRVPELAIMAYEGYMKDMTTKQGIGFEMCWSLRMKTLTAFSLIFWSAMTITFTKAYYSRLPNFAPIQLQRATFDQSY